MSALRGFSAPVRLELEQTRGDLVALIGFDDDPYVRWDASQRLAFEAIDEGTGVLAADYVDALRRVLDGSSEAAMKAQLLALPTEASIADRHAQNGLVDVHAIHSARTCVAAALGQGLSSELTTLVEEGMASTEAYAPSAAQIGQRALVHTALNLLVAGNSRWLDAAREMYFAATNLSDRLCAARLVVHHSDDPNREEVLQHFFDRWQSENLVVNQWFVMQATRPAMSTVGDVMALTEHEAFDWRNPNKVRSLISSFAGANPVAFHSTDGSGYALLGDAVRRLQSDNPQIASRMLAPLTRFKRYAHGQDMMRAELTSIAALDNLSQDVFEVVQRSLSDD